MHKLFLFLPLLALGSCAKQTHPSSEPPITTQATRLVPVATSAELKAALLDARPGDEIRLADGVYSGRFVVGAAADGTANQPIVLRGSRGAVLDGGSIQTGYVLHLQADHWRVKGFRVTNGLKGIMADGIHFTEIDSVQVDETGEEGIHLRRHSSHNLIRNCTVIHAGKKTPDYGEGIYIGSAKSNWASYTEGLPDRSDSNTIEGCRIGPFITAECIDVKEGTTGGVVRNNQFNSEGITGANSGDSWMDVKGNGWLIEGNVGVNPAGSVLRDGFQVNVAYPGWGNNNEFRGNQCTVNAAGYGINIRLTSSNGTATGNKVYNSNTASGAASGLTNISITN